MPCVTLADSLPTNKHLLTKSHAAASPYTNHYTRIISHVVRRIAEQWRWRERVRRQHKSYSTSFTSLTENRAHYAVGAPDVTIKFSGSDLLIQAHKAALTAGATFFSEHFQRVSFLLHGTVSPS